MPSEGPPRLKYSRTVPPELVQALEALHQGSDETARMARVGEKLQPVMNAAQPGFWVAKSAMLKLLVGAITLLVPALFWLQHEGPWEVGHHKPMPMPRVLEVPAVTPASNQVTQRPQTSDATATAAGEPDQPHRAVQSGTPHAHGPRARTPASAAPATSKNSLKTEPATPQSDQAIRVSDVAATEAPEPEAPAAHDRGLAQEPRATDPTQRDNALSKPSVARAASSGHVEASESQLLVEARLAMRSKPERALLTLQEHEKRFPNGLLVPERELLAIEALRSLGRTVEANARFERFRARYPNSFHLKGLQH